MKSRTGIAVAIIAIVLLACLLSACGKETPPSTLTAPEVIGRCMETMDAADSFHFRLEHDGGGTPIAGGLTMNEAEGDIARPDRLKVQTWVEMIGLGDMKVEFITVGSAIYMTNPFTDEWEPLPTDFSVVSFFDPDTGVTAILEGMTGPAILEEEKVKGLRCYHIKGKIASQCLNSIALSSVEGAVIDTEVWIGTEEFLLRRIRLEGQITEDEKAGIVRTITLSDFDQSVEIELPE